MLGDNKLTLIAAVALLSMTACSDSDSPENEEPPEILTAQTEITPGHAECPLGGLQTDTGPDTDGDGQLSAGEINQTEYQCDTAEDLASADKPWLSLDNLKTGISTDEPRSYYLHVDEQAESLVIYLASGVAGESLGDPDLFVKYDGTAEAGAGIDEGLNDCISYYGAGSNEVCIIDDPQPGDYHILIDASGQVSDATLFATTSLFNVTHACNDEINIRAQSMTQTDIESACGVLTNAKTRFDDLFNSDINPYFGQPVIDDLNQVTHFHIFSSLSNHMAWVEHLWETDNSSGIYFETSPTEWWHNSEVLTFNGIEWTGGLPVIRSLAHEYIHALDGRYIKEGAYRWDMGWWSEGIAEYLGVHNELPYQRVVHGHEGDAYSLAQIFNREDDVDVYSWGELAAAFLIEKHPEQVTQMLTYMYSGQWIEFQSLMADIAQNYQAEFEDFYLTEVPQQFSQSAASLSLEEFALVEGRGGWLFSVDVPANTPSVSFSTNGGSGNVDLWVNRDSAAHPFLDTVFDCASVTDDSNEEICTIENPEAGTYYLTVGSDFSGSDIVDLYVAACSGVDCQVSLPESKETVAVDQPYLPHWPEKGEFGGCYLEETYGRDTLTYASEFTVTNNSDIDVNLHWVSNYGGEAGGKFDTLAPGGNYTSEWWRVGDRMLLSDAASNCIAVAIVNDTTNVFDIDNELVANAETEAPEPTVGEIGSCPDLLAPYSRTSESAAIQVTNSASQTINLHWVDDSSGLANTGNDYGPLDNEESYEADYWVVGDRMAVYANEQCVGVIDVTESNMSFEITDSLLNP